MCEVYLSIPSDYFYNLHIELYIFDQITVEFYIRSIKNKYKRINYQWSVLKSKWTWNPYIFPRKKRKGVLLQQPTFNFSRYFAMLSSRLINYLPRLTRVLLSRYWKYWYLIIYEREVQNIHFLIYLLKQSFDYFIFWATTLSHNPIRLFLSLSSLLSSRD